MRVQEADAVDRCRKLYFPQEPFVLCPNPDDSTTISCHDQFKLLIVVAACNLSIVFPRLFRLKPVQTVGFRVKLKQLRLVRSENHHKASYYGIGHFTKLENRLDLFLEFERRNGLQAEIVRGNPPDLEEPFFADCYEYIDLGQVFKHCYSLSVDSNTSIHLAQLSNMEQNHSSLSKPQS